MYIECISCESAVIFYFFFNQLSLSNPTNQSADFPDDLFFCKKYFLLYINTCINFLSAFLLLLMMEMMMKMMIRDDKDKVTAHTHKHQYICSSSALPCRCLVV